MNETTKCRARRSAEGFERFLQGRGIDIGCGEDKITPEADGWDTQEGDAQTLEGVPNGCYDFVYSSHCLEHLRDPLEALLNWWRVLNPGGYLIVAVPDEDLYEHGIWPSVYNGDHKHTFTPSKGKSWSPVSVSLVELIRLLPDHKLISLTITDAGYDYEAEDDEDQTLGAAEAAIEMVVQKCGEPPAMRTPFAEILRCGCGHGRCGIEGVDQDGCLAVLCPKCGRRGRVTMAAGSGRSGGSGSPGELGLV